MGFHEFNKFKPDTRSTEASRRPTVQEVYSQLWANRQNGISPKRMAQAISCSADQALHVLQDLCRTANVQTDAETFAQATVETRFFIPIQPRATKAITRPPGNS